MIFESFLKGKTSLILDVNDIFTGIYIRYEREIMCIGFRFNSLSVFQQFVSISGLESLDFDVDYDPLEKN